MPTLSPAKNNPSVKAAKRDEPSAPGAERILQAYADAQSSAQNAVQKALICGQLIVEQRDSIMGAQSFDRTKPESTKFDFWMEKNCQLIPRRTCYRWMQLAERVMDACSLHGGEEIPISMALSAPTDELPIEARELRQAVFDFIDGKTMKECLAGVVVEGDEAHRITRAHNGATKGGAGGNRKNFVGFTAVKLRHISTFVAHDLTAAEQAKIVASFGAAIEKWPKWLVKPLAELATKEAKLADEERAARGGGK